MKRFLTVLSLLIALVAVPGLSAAKPKPRSKPASAKRAKAKTKPAALKPEPAKAEAAVKSEASAPPAPPALPPAVPVTRVEPWNP